MDTFTASSIHEAGHTIVWALQGEHLGPMDLVSVLPDADSSGRVRGTKRGSGPLTPRQLQAVGYMNAAGVRAEILAGFDPPPEAAAKDARNIALAQHYSGRGPRFTIESMVGAELLLRVYWASVQKMAGWLRSAGTLTPPYAGNLARMALEEPPRPLPCDLDTISDMVAPLERFPEYANLSG